MIALIALLSACEPALPPAPMVSPDAPLPSGTQTRTMSFRAKNGDTQVAAQCSVGGAAMNISFETPASVDIPVGDDGRAQVSNITCRLGNDVADWEGIPGPETRSVKAVFGDTGFGPGALIFGPREGIVQYYVRRGELVRVSGAPAT